MHRRFNEALLAQRFAEIREVKDLLEPYTRWNVETFTANREAVDAAKYRLLMGIEACAQVCSHLLSRLTAQPPESMPSCFLRLAEQGVLSEPLAQRLVHMARFRNLLVHRYETVDNEKVYQIICEGLGDWEAFIQSVQQFLQRERHA